MSMQNRKISTKSALKNIVTAMFMMSFFTVFWAVFMLVSFMPSVWAMVGFVIFIALSGWLVYMAVRANRSVSALPDEIKQEAEIVLFRSSC